MRSWSALAAVLWVASCSSDDSGAPASSASADAGASSSASSSSGTANEADTGTVDPVSVLAAFDLPRTARTKTLSALTTDGTQLFALPDRDPRLVTLTPNADYTEFTVGDGVQLTDETALDWDGEGLAYAPDGTFFVVANETEPRVIHVAADGHTLGPVNVPPEYADQQPNNKGLESLSLSPTGAYLFSCNEQALTRDGKPPSKTQGTALRILRLPVADGAATEYAYRTEPLGEGTGGDMGVSDVVALDDESLLVLERGYQSDYGNTIRVFRVGLAGARDVSAEESLGDAPDVLEKELVVDLVKLPAGNVTHPSKQPNPLLDNYEGLTLGPKLPDGRQLLLLLSDDNGQASQVARVLVLAVDHL